MTAAQKHETWTIDAFLNWADKQGWGRYELIDGVIRAIARERVPTFVRPDR